VNPAGGEPLAVVRAHHEAQALHAGDYPDAMRLLHKIFRNAAVFRVHNLDHVSGGAVNSFHIVASPVREKRQCGDQTQ
jgi:hypothetical protein